jgi:hypothetical protein
MAARLPPLAVYILQAGSVRRVLLDDPRDAFCRVFNMNAEQFGMKAVTRVRRRPGGQARSGAARKSARRITSDAQA